VNRRLDSNPALAFAARLANDLRLPVLFYEGLTCSHPHANDRFHAFILEGVPDNARRAAALGVGYAFYLRRKRSERNDVLYRLAGEAGALVTDDFPGYLVRDHNRSVAAKIGIPYYAVDASCIVPLAHSGKQEYAAYTLRPKINRVLEEYLKPVEPIRVQRRWTGAPPACHLTVTREDIPRLLAGSEIDHGIAPSTEFRGGRSEAQRRLRRFLKHNLKNYPRLSREPSARATSQLSPYLHFGHISSLEIALAVRDYAEEHKLIVPEYLEQLIVRRELAYNFARYGPDPGTLAALPAWAAKTLRKHARDGRSHVYSREQFERAETHDPLWNATQRELVRAGVIQGYYRMYWGKKIIEWCKSHQEALEIMISLHDRYALDGRDPNTYANILWCFGLHDRPWGERPVFGMVRYMSLEGMRRKTDVDAYVRQMA
jgi:deoxyribodipyrimidine photo-lyase